MFVFVIYAVMVWYLAARWRRRWAGFAAVFGGLMLLLLLAWLHIQIYYWTDGAIGLPVLQILLYPYIMLVFGIGLFTACLPRAALPGQCLFCRYDLSGLESETTICPECGIDLALPPEATLAAIEALRAAQSTSGTGSDGGQSAVVTLEALATARRERAQVPASPRSPANAAPRAVLRSEEQ